MHYILIFSWYLAPLLFFFCLTTVFIDLLFHSYVKKSRTSTFLLHLLFTSWHPVITWTWALRLSLLTGVLGVFCPGGKWTTLIHLQSSAGHWLLPWLHFTMPVNFWNGRKFQISPIVAQFILKYQLCLTLCVSLHWIVHGVNEGGGEHQTAQLDCSWHCRRWCGHLCSHGKTLTESLISYP